MDDGRPIFLQIAELIERQIIDGSLPEGTQVPSINEFASFHRINPATALKGVSLLVERGVLIKRRGIGMFVADGARERLLAERRERFAAEYVHPLLLEASGLELTTDQLIAIIRKESAS